MKYICSLAKSIGISLLVGFVLITISEKLGSSYLSKFVSDSLLLLLIALTAINTATSSIVVTKLSDLLKANPRIDFQSTITSIKRSVVEQIAIIVIACALLVLKDGTYSSPGAAAILTYWADMLLYATLSFSVLIVWDTADGIFIILRHENTANGGKP